MENAIYKKTLLGLVPSEWEEIMFSNIFEEVSETTNDTDRYPLYSLTIEDGVTPKSERYERSFLITKETDSYKIVKKDEFVYNPMNLRFGAIARLKEDKEVAVSGYYNVFKVKPGYSPEFMDYYLKSERMMYLYNVYATGSLKEKQRVHYSQFIQFQLPLPSIEEAKRITEILTKWDKAIELKEALIQEKKEFKRGIISNIFSNKKGISLGAKKVKLEEIIIGKGQYGINAPSVEKNDNLPTYLRITDISEDGYIIKNGLQSVNHIDFAKYILCEHDIVFARTGASTGKAYLYDKSDGELVYAGFLIKFSLDSNKVIPEYFKYSLQTEEYKHWVKVMSMRSGQPGINAEEYRLLPITLPNIEGQKKVSNLLKSIDKELKLLENEKKVLEKQKNFLTQQLLTGKIRVKV